MVRYTSDLKTWKFIYSKRTHSLLSFIRIHHPLNSFSRLNHKIFITQWFFFRMAENDATFSPIINNSTSRPIKVLQVLQNHSRRLYSEYSFRFVSKLWVDWVINRNNGAIINIKISKLPRIQTVGSRYLIP